MRVVVAGAGLAGRRLIARLAANHHDVTAIDLNREVCELISSKLGVAAICGNATDITTLEESEIGKAEVAVALMRQSADNLAFSLLAKSAGAGRIIARMANPKYREAYEQAGVTSIIDIAGLFLDQLLLEIERPQIHEVATFGAGEGVILQVTISKHSRAVGKTVREIMSERRFPRDWLIAGIFRERDGQLIIQPGRNTCSPGIRFSSVERQREPKRRWTTLRLPMALLRSSGSEQRKQCRIGPSNRRRTSSIPPLKRRAEQTRPSPIRRLILALCHLYSLAFDSE